MSFSFLLLKKKIMFSFLPKGDFVCLYIHLYSLLSLLLVNIRKALPGQGSQDHTGIFLC